MRLVALAVLTCCACLARPALTTAQVTTLPGTPAETAGAAQPDTPAEVDLARVLVQGAEVNAPPATLTFQNRDIVELRATVGFRAPAMRVLAAARLVRQLVDDDLLGPVVTRPLAGGIVVSVGSTDTVALVPADIDPLGGETLEDTARRATATLQLALDEAIELRTPWRLLQSTALALLATVALVVVLRLLIRGHDGLVARLTGAANRHLQHLPGGEVLRVSRLLDFLRYLVTLSLVVAGLALTYSWLFFVLRRFPYTRPWGEALRGFLLERTLGLGAAFIGAIPDLFTVLLIVFLTRFAVKMAGLLFAAIERGQATLPGVYPETAQPTRRLVTGFLWLFALALAYPYLPGSDTDAFKGVSVFIGLMVSLGSTGIVNQVMSGLTLTYSRALRKGDFVRIGDVEGTVTHLGTLSTKLKTPRREEVTIPNAVMVSTQTINYSRFADSEGVFVTTSVTIGYDVPWRQVHALLLMAAECTPGVRGEPKPAVRQTALKDFYVEYTLFVCLEDPASRLPTLDLLHARILDQFNEHGVQIMSPNYEADPDAPKIVPRAKWFAEPASVPDPTEQVT